MDQASVGKQFNLRSRVEEATETTVAAFVRFIDIISIFVAPTPLDNSVPEVALWMSQI